MILGGVEHEKVYEEHEEILYGNEEADKVGRQRS